MFCMQMEMNQKWTAAGEEGYLEWGSAVVGPTVAHGGRASDDCFLFQTAEGETREWEVVVLPFFLFSSIFPAILPFFHYFSLSLSKKPFYFSLPVSPFSLKNCRFLSLSLFSSFLFFFVSVSPLLLLVAVAVGDAAGDKAKWWWLLQGAASSSSCYLCPSPVFILFFVV